MTRDDLTKPTIRPTGKSRIPHFNSVEEAAEFWDTHDSSDFADEFEDVSNVKFVVRRSPVTKALSVRVDEVTFAELVERARQQGIGPSTLIRMWILERLGQSRSA
jgi:hypothetical protein